MVDPNKYTFLGSPVVWPLICYVKLRLSVVPVKQYQPRDMAIAPRQLLAIPHLSERGGASPTHLPDFARCIVTLLGGTTNRLRDNGVLMVLYQFMQSQD